MSPTDFCKLIGLTEVKKPSRFNGVGVAKDKDGVYIKTHRCRSESYRTLEDIPDSVIEFIRSTG